MTLFLFKGKTLLILPIPRSLGIRSEPNGPLISQIKDNSHHNMIEEAQLSDLLSKYIKESWPAHSDVLRAFKVFDTEGVGFIKVTMLKRFLVQAQLDVDESVCEFIISTMGCVCMQIFLIYSCHLVIK